MSRFYNKKLDHLTTYVPGEQPQNLSSFVKLNTNESPFAPSEKALKRASEELYKLNLYPDPDAKELVQEIASYYGIENSQVAVFNGSDELLSFCFQIFTPNGACYADITYGFYPVYSKVFNVDANIVPLRGDYSICVDDYASQKGTVFIANPNATTGLCLPLSDIEKLLLQDKNRLVVVDEAYVDFGADSAVSLLDKYDNLLIVQTMSKSRSFAGARLGICLSNKDIVSDIHRIRNCFNPYNVNRVTLSGAVGAWSDKEYFNACTSKIIENREYLKVELKKLGFFVTDSKSNFLLAGSDKISGEELYTKLKEKKVLVRHFKQDRISNFVRITIGTREQVDFLLEKIKEILA